MYVLICQIQLTQKNRNVQQNQYYLIAQMLTAAGNELFYYTFPDENNHNYEIDFLLSRGNKICPIEVKSSGYKTHKSLDDF